MTDAGAATFAQAPALLRVAGLSVAIGDEAIVKDVTFHVDGGEIVGLVGASGSGKTLTALALMRLLPAGARTGGALWLNGASILDKSRSAVEAMRGREVGMVFQEPLAVLNPLMRIGDQVAETVRVHAAGSRAQAAAVARATLDAVGLGGDAGALQRHPYELSGGARQRVAIAIAIALRPALLIADEPTTALDVSTQAHILALLRSLVRERGMGMLLVSHDLAVIAQVADRILVMRDGRIVETGTAAALRRLRHPYSKALLAAVKVRPWRAAAGAGTDAASDAATDAAPAPHGAPTAPVLEVRGIVRDYPRPRRSPWHAAAPLRAVDDVSLRVHAGETVALVGESGAGKSSLVRAMLALERPQAGSVWLLGEDFVAARGPALRRLRRSIQAVFQDPFGSFDPRWPVERLIAEPFHLFDAMPDATERSRRVCAMLEQVGLQAADRSRLPHEFSGGQRQRIAIARALITQPAVIVLDEALSALDVLVRAQILDLLHDLAERLHVAYVFVSHDLNVVRAIADRVYVMQQGRIVEHGATAQVFDAPRHSYTRQLLAATPRIDAR